MKATAIRLLVATGAILLAPSLAGAAPAITGDFTLTGVTNYVAQGPDGNVWVTENDPLTNEDVAMIPANARDDSGIREFDLPGVSSPGGIVTGPDGRTLWVIDGSSVASFSPSDPVGTARATAVAGIGTPRSLVVGPDRRLWTASGDQAIRIDPSDGSSVGFRVRDMAANDIAVGGDGNLWIADGTGRVDGVRPDGTPLTPVDTGGMVQGVIGGPNDQLAYGNPGNSPEQVGLIAIGNPTPLKIDRPSIDPTDLVFAQDGAYWMTNFGGNSLSRMTTDGRITDLPGLSSGPRRIATGPNGTLWVSLEQGRRVARVSGVEAPVVTPPGGGSGGGGGGGGGTTPPAGRDTTPPTVSKLFLSSKRLHPGQHATIAVTLSEPATLTLRFTRVLSGKRTRSGRCVAATRALRRRPACTRVVKVGTLTRRGVGAGAARLTWDGTVAGHKLAVGSYRLAIDATDAAGNRSTVSAQTGFKVVRPARRRHARSRTPRARARR
jgi:streptogramin lyase